jgi:hypothetical protein
VVILNIFYRFGIMYQEKSGNPVAPGQPITFQALCTYIEKRKHLELIKLEKPT